MCYGYILRKRFYIFIFIFQYASSLKSALTIAATLKNERNKDLDVEGVYDSICDIESELRNKNGNRSNHH